MKQQSERLEIQYQKEKEKKIEKERQERLIKIQKQIDKLNDEFSKRFPNIEFKTEIANDKLAYTYFCDICLYINLEKLDFDTIDEIYSFLDQMDEICTFHQRYSPGKFQVSIQNITDKPVYKHKEQIIAENRNPQEEMKQGLIDVEGEKYYHVYDKDNNFLYNDPRDHIKTPFRNVKQEEYVFDKNDNDIFFITHIAFPDYGHFVIEYPKFESKELEPLNKILRYKFATKYSRPTESRSEYMSYRIHENKRFVVILFKEYLGRVNHDYTICYDKAKKKETSFNEIFEEVYKMKATSENVAKVLGLDLNLEIPDDVKKGENPWFYHEKGWYLHHFSKDEAYIPDFYINDKGDLLIFGYLPHRDFYEGPYHKYLFKNFMKWY